jgi:hypothetical protein
MHAMKHVFVICSVHYETGFASAAELHWLLGRLRPDVIFLERSSTGLAAFLDGSCGTLESAAVRRYRDLHAVELVPVDLQLQAVELKHKFDELFDRIGDSSPGFCQLELTNRHHTEKGGFAYLNSSISAVLQSEMQREMRATVEAIGEPTLAELFALWTRTNDLRELTMISGVESFAKQNSFEKGVLLVGSAHLPTLYEKSQHLRSDGPSPITWDFDWQLEEASLEADSGPGVQTTDRRALG